jgi:hypothetical protein
MAVRHKTSKRYDPNSGKSTMGIKSVTSSLLYRRASSLQSVTYGTNAFEFAAPCRLEVGDTAD